MERLHDDSSKKCGAGRCDRLHFSKLPSKAPANEREFTPTLLPGEANNNWRPGRQTYEVRTSD